MSQGLKGTEQPKGQSPAIALREKNASLNNLKQSSQYSGTLLLRYSVLGQYLTSGLPTRLSA